MKCKDKKNMRGFTLIELIAVLVTLALIALIVTPLVMNIVKKAKDSANKRSIDAYGKAVELAIATHLLDNGDYPTSLDNLTVEYSGNEVICNIQTLNEDGSIYLSECSVSGHDAKDSSTEDGWYHYGKLSAPTYQAYNIGDVVTYNGMDSYVIENSDSKSDRVTMLKAEPLTVDEVNTYGGVGTGSNHVNMYVDTATPSAQYQSAYDKNGYGGMAYYSSSTCGYDESDWNSGGCTTDYVESEVKYVVDAWSNDKFLNGVLVEDETGYSARLISENDLKNNFKYERVDLGTSGDVALKSDPNLYSWLYDKKYKYWTMSSYDDSSKKVWFVSDDGSIYASSVYGLYGFDTSVVVRPVVTLKKSVI